MNTFARVLTGLLSLALALGAAPVGAQQRPGSALNGDYIVAVINQELVTAAEVQQRIAMARAQAARTGARLPPDDQLRKEMVEAMIQERVLITHARESGQKVDEAEIDRAVANVAQQNQLTPAQLRERLRREGVDYERFRGNVRDQIMLERVREREVQSRIRVSDAEIDAFLEKQRARGPLELNIAQILVTVPEGATDDVVAERKALADRAVERIRGGEAFEQVAREMSDDANKARGGEIGLRPAQRLPDVFLDQVKPLKPGEVSMNVLRTGAGFHVLKLIERRDGASLRVTQTRARHVLLRTSAQVTQEAAIERLRALKGEIASGTTSFEAVARQTSEDVTAARGGDLGWVSPGTFVPEFQQAMDRLPPGGVSDPVVSRFGVHLIQVVDRRSVDVDPKQVREQARNVLREQKFDEAYLNWVRELRARAYVEMREPPQ